jgi:hypothetical protein
MLSDPSLFFAAPEFCPSVRIGLRKCSSREPNWFRAILYYAGQRYRNLGVHRAQEAREERVLARGVAGPVPPCKLSLIMLQWKAGADGYVLAKKVGDKEIVLLQKDFVVREPDVACGQK